MPARDQIGWVEFESPDSLGLGSSPCKERCKVSMFKEARVIHRKNGQIRIMRCCLRCERKATLRLVLRSLLCKRDLAIELIRPSILLFMRAAPIAVLKSAVKRNACHPWVYAEEISNMLEVSKLVPRGGIVEVHNEAGQSQGYGTFNRASSIAVRLSGSQEPQVKSLVLRAARKRMRIDQTRLLAGDCEGLPGLDADLIHDSVNLHAASAGAGLWLKEAEQVFKEEFNLAVKSTSCTFRLERDVEEPPKVSPTVLSQTRQAILSLTRAADSFLEVGPDLFGSFIAHRCKSTQVTVLTVEPSAFRESTENLIVARADDMLKELRAMAGSQLTFDFLSICPPQRLERNKERVRGEHGKNFRPSNTAIDDYIRAGLAVVAPGGRMSVTMMLPLGRLHEGRNFAISAVNSKLVVESMILGVSTDAPCLATNPDKWVPVTMLCRCPSLI